MIAQLRTLEGGFNKTDASLPAADVDPEARERLAALGYVGIFRRQRIGSRYRARRSEGQDRPLQQAGTRRPTSPRIARTIRTAPFDSRRRAAQRSRSARIRRSSTPGSCWARSTCAHGDLEKAVDDFKQHPER